MREEKNALHTLSHNLLIVYGRRLATVLLILRLHLRSLTVRGLHCICVWCQKITRRYWSRCVAICYIRTIAIENLPGDRIHMPQINVRFGRKTGPTTICECVPTIEIMSWRDDIRFLCHRMTFTKSHRNQNDRAFRRTTKNKSKTLKICVFRHRLRLRNSVWANPEYFERIGILFANLLLPIATASSNRTN